MENFMGIQANSGENILGKFLYFSISKVLIEKEDMREICDALNFPFAGNGRTSVTDAFRSATGDIYKRFTEEAYGELKIRKIYCRDNKSDDKNILSR
jgi:hypothetical protein